MPTLTTGEAPAADEAAGARGEHVQARGAESHQRRGFPRPHPGPRQGGAGAGEVRGGAVLIQVCEWN